MTRLDLERFSATDVARQVADILGEPGEPSFVDRIHARSDGNPFFVEELVEASREPHGKAALPRTLADTLAGRIALLPEASQRVMGVVALAGRPVDERLVATVTEVPEIDVREPDPRSRDRPPPGARRGDRRPASAPRVARRGPRA